MHSRSPASRFAFHTFALSRSRTISAVRNCAALLALSLGAGWSANDVQAQAQAPTHYSWQEPQARVLPTGGLEWTPKPFVFEKGESMRYIDLNEAFAGGGNHGACLGLGR